MQSFLALRRYYIHDYRAIQDWFGNRGFPLEKGDLKEWCYDGHFLYWLCNDSAPVELTPDEDGNVVFAVLDSLHFEPYAEMPYYESPFANKVRMNDDNTETT